MRQGQLEIAVEAVQLDRGQARPLRRRQSQRRGGLGGQAPADLLDRDVAARAGVAAGPHPAAARRDLAQVLGAGDDVQVVARPRGVQQVGGDHRVRGQAAQAQAAPAQQDLGGLGVVDVLAHGLGGQDRRQGAEGVGLADARRDPEVAVAERQVGAGRLTAPDFRFHTITQSNIRYVTHALDGGA